MAKFVWPQLSKENWISFLTNLGMPYDSFQYPNSPCPICGGDDRFTFNMWKGKPRYICRVADGHARSGDLIQLLRDYYGWTFAEASKAIHGEKVEVVRQTNYVQTRNEKQEKRDALKKGKQRKASLMKGAVPFVDQSFVMDYLRSRDLPPGGLGPDAYVSNLAWGVKEGKLFTHPALILLIRSFHGEVIGAHKTFITASGKKIDFAPAKQITKFGLTVSGGAIRLGDSFLTSDAVGVAEGWESARMASNRFGVPVWACLNAAGIRSFVPPYKVKDFFIFADHDTPKPKLDPETKEPTGEWLSPAGQTSANSLSTILYTRGLAQRVHVEIPLKPGTDWADYPGVSPDVWMRVALAGHEARV